MTIQPSYEQLTINNFELEKQKISDKNFIAELMDENSHYQTVINTYEIERKKRGYH